MTATTGYATGQQTGQGYTNEKVLVLVHNGHGNGHLPGRLETEVSRDLRFIGFINIPTEAVTETRFGYNFSRVGLPAPSEGNTLYAKLIEKGDKPLSALLYEGPKINEVPKFHVTSKSRLYNILYRLKEKAKNLYVIK
ncbi:hypothetical protein HYX07_00365 [Candidatus Woesearchaeota archaeon]|nr:hypothetical protein [Candidatus Woesearchaeota archaeon]